MPTPRNLIEKIWDAHVVVPGEAGGPDVLYVDTHLLHEVTSPQAFAVLRERGLSVRRPDQTFATIDHAVPTTEPLAGGEWPGLAGAAELQVKTLEANCAGHGIELCGREHPARGIVHVVAAELGVTRPGSTIVCGDSHTSTHGAVGALAFGIGTSEVAHVLGTQCLLQQRPRTMAVELTGTLGAGVSAKDLALAWIGEAGAGGAAGHVVEYRGGAVRSLDMEGRMTLCNLSIEAGARAGLIAPDERTIAYMESRPRTPMGEAKERLTEQWRSLQGDEGAVFDATLSFDLGALAPQVTWGTSPDMVTGIHGAIPGPTNRAQESALAYTGLEPGASLAGQSIDVVFIGSCTNGRIGDLREAARILDGNRVADGVRTLVVPGSRAVQRAAEAEGLAEIFTRAGAEWRAPGCSMCIAMNGDVVPPGGRALSTSNRNFEGRQGPGSITFLSSPSTAAASAIRGVIADPRLHV